MFKLLASFMLFMASQWASAAGFSLTSPDIAPGGTIKMAQVYKGFGCTGDNISPALSWHNPPAGTKSFALLVHDPDAPTGGSGWWHWLLINIPATTNTLPAGAGYADGSALPAGAVQVTTDFGAAGWGGPCPPVGDKPHRYIFSLYALKTEKLDFPAGASAALVGFLVNANSLGKTQLTGFFGR